MFSSWRLSHGCDSSFPVSFLAFLHIVTGSAVCNIHYPRSSPRLGALSSMQMPQRLTSCQWHKVLRLGRPSGALHRNVKHDMYLCSISLSYSTGTAGIHHEIIYPFFLLCSSMGLQHVLIVLMIICVLKMQQNSIPDAPGDICSTFTQVRA